MQTIQGMTENNTWYGSKITFIYSWGLIVIKENEPQQIPWEYRFREELNLLINSKPPIKARNNLKNMECLSSAENILSCKINTNWKHFVDGWLLSKLNKAMRKSHFSYFLNINQFCLKANTFFPCEEREKTKLPLIRKGNFSADAAVLFRPL